MSIDFWRQYKVSHEMGIPSWHPDFSSDNRSSLIPLTYKILSPYNPTIKEKRLSKKSGGHECITPIIFLFIERQIISDGRLMGGG